MARHLWSSWSPGSADSLVSTYLLRRLEPILQRKPFKHLKVHLRSRSEDVSQPPLDGDMERYRLHVWEASSARQRSLEPRRTYLLVASAPLLDSFFSRSRKTHPRRLDAPVSRPTIPSIKTLYKTVSIR